MRKLFFILFTLLSVSALEAQTMVYLENADSLTYDEERHGDAQVLYGDVQFRHDDALMYCDSAYFYEASNSLDAFGNVRFVQGDTLFGYCDYLYYDGNTKFARMRNHVELVNRETHMTTDSLNYDRVYDVAWYWTGGQLQDTVNTLTSVWGQYEPNKRQALFSNKVHLINTRFTMDADTLTYNTASHIAFILGKTVIVYEEETTIYSTLGYYNTYTEQSTLYNHSLIVHSDGKTMTGDTIYYDKQNKWGRALSNMQIVDSTRHVTLTGNYGEMHESNWPEGSRSFATDSALMVDWSDSTNFSYMHADTIAQNEILYEVIDSLVQKDSILIDSVLTWQAPDTVWRDTSYQQVRGFRGVRVYRDDMQAIADSSIYISRDSVLFLFGNPICWKDEQQIAADNMDIHFRDSTVDYAHGTSNCIAIQQKTDTYFNQMAGKEMYAYVRDGELKLVSVNGNAETVFFPQDEKDGTWIGVNKTQSSFVKMYLENKQIHHVVFTTTTTGTMYPIDQLSEPETHLSQFFWADAERPKQPGDVFLRPAHTPRGSNSQAAAAPDEGAGHKRGRNKGASASDTNVSSRSSDGAPTPATGTAASTAAPATKKLDTSTRSSSSSSLGGGLLKKK